MTKKYLIIIPIPWTNYSFSAPVGWLFSNHVDKVEGIYGFELTKSMAKNFQYFIIELNWFTQLKEFLILSSFIKKYNPKSKILVGGLYASLMWRKIFKYIPIDYYIQGDNEYPIQCFLNQEDPKRIPNFVGRDFCNDISYIFQSKDFSGLEFNLDWFPSYFKYKNNFKLYPLPMLLSSKGGCSTVHDGCDYCMGSKHAVLKNVYNRNPLTMSNNNLMSLLTKIEKNSSVFVFSFYQPINIISMNIFLNLMRILKLTLQFRLTKLKIYYMPLKGVNCVYQYIMRA